MEFYLQIKIFHLCIKGNLIFILHEKGTFLLLFYPNTITNYLKISKKYKMSRKYPLFYWTGIFYCSMRRVEILTLGDRTHISYSQLCSTVQCKFLGPTTGSSELIDLADRLGIVIFRTSTDNSNVLPRLKITSPDNLFSNFNVHTHHLGILLKCTIWFDRSGLGPMIDYAFLSISWILLMLLNHTLSNMDIGHFSTLISINCQRWVPGFNIFYTLKK